MYERFAAFKEQEMKQQEDRRALERATVLRAEEEQRKAQEEKQRVMIEKHAVDEYKQHQEEIERDKLEREKHLRSQMTKLGLELDQINSILAIPSMKDSYPKPSSLITSNSTTTATNNTNFNHKGHPILNSNDIRTPKGQKRSGIRSIFGRSHATIKDFEISPSTVPELISEKRADNSLHNVNNGLDIELWLIDSVSRQHTELALPQRLTTRKLQTLVGKEDNWQRLARLHPTWLRIIQDFLASRNERAKPETPWKLADVDLPRRLTQSSLFGHHQGSHTIKLVLSRQSQKVKSGKMIVPTPGALSQQSQTNLGDNADQVVGNQDQSELTHTLGSRASLRPQKEVSFAPLNNDHSMDNDAESSGERSTPVKNDSILEAEEKPEVFIIQQEGDNSQSPSPWDTYLPRKFISEEDLNRLGIFWLEVFSSPVARPHVNSSTHRKVRGKLTAAECMDLLRNTDGPSSSTQTSGLFSLTTISTPGSGLSPESAVFNMAGEKAQRHRGTEVLDFLPIDFDHLKDGIARVEQQYRDGTLWDAQDYDFSGLSARMKNLINTIDAAKRQRGQNKEQYVNHVRLDEPFIVNRTGSRYKNDFHRQSDRYGLSSPQRPGYRSPHRGSYTEWPGPESVYRRPQIYRERDDPYIQRYTSMPAPTREYYPSSPHSPALLVPSRWPPGRYDGGTYGKYSAGDRRYRARYRDREAEFNEPPNRPILVERYERRRPSPVENEWRQHYSYTASPDPPFRGRPRSPPLTKGRAHPQIYRTSSYNDGVDDPGIRVWAQPESPRRRSPPYTLIKRSPKLLMGKEWDSYRRVDFDGHPYDQPGGSARHVPRRRSSSPIYHSDRVDKRRPATVIINNNNFESDSDSPDERMHHRHNIRREPIHASTANYHVRDISDDFFHGALPRRTTFSRQSKSSEDLDEPETADTRKTGDDELIAAMLHRYTTFEADKENGNATATVVANLDIAPPSVAPSAFRPETIQSKDTSEQKDGNDAWNFNFPKGKAQESRPPHTNWKLDPEGGNFSRQTTFDTNGTDSTTDLQGTLPRSNLPGHVSEVSVETGDHEHQDVVEDVPIIYPTMSDNTRANGMNGREDLDGQATERRRRKRSEQVATVQEDFEMYD